MGAGGRKMDQTLIAVLLSKSQIRQSRPIGEKSTYG
jgi:hypothetical protein